jgi:hypothetical protein
MWTVSHAQLPGSWLTPWCMPLGHASLHLAPSRALPAAGCCAARCSLMCAHQPASLAGLSLAGGGPDCPPCQVEQLCNYDDDCGSGTCTYQQTG